MPLRLSRDSVTGFERICQQLSAGDRPLFSLRLGKLIPPTSSPRQTPTQATAASGAACTALSTIFLTSYTACRPSSMPRLMDACFCVWPSPFWTNCCIWRHLVSQALAISFPVGPEATELGSSRGSLADRIFSYASTRLDSLALSSS